VTAPPPGPIVRVEDLRIRFATQDRRETVKAVDGVSFGVLPGETFGIIGESGSGKSTLGRAVVCLLKPTEGRVELGGVDPYSLPSAELRRRRRAFQIIFQDPNAALNPRMSVIDSIREPLDIIADQPRAERDRIAREMLERVGLRPEFGARYPHELSGGQKQRINIARVLTVRPSVIVCDEVVAALDVSIRADILNLFAELQREFGLTYLFITHDLGVVSHVSSRIAVMYLGKFMELGPADEIAERPLHPYTQALLSAEPIPLPSGMRATRRIILQGEIPSPTNPPSGCRFRTRCPHAQAVCASDMPAWREAAPGRFVACHFAGDVTGHPIDTSKTKEATA
jgi:oligopeptide/dipeptide ABC transporter ATP-binding protein